MMVYSQTTFIQLQLPTLSLMYTSQVSPYLFYHGVIEDDNAKLCDVLHPAAKVC